MTPMDEALQKFGEAIRALAMEEEKYAQAQAKVMAARRAQDEAEERLLEARARMNAAFEEVRTAAAPRVAVWPMEKPNPGR